MPAGADLAHVVDQRPAGDGLVTVTYSLPGLVRAAVTVRAAAWREGEHHPLAAGLAPWLASLLPGPMLEHRDLFVPGDD